MNIVFVKLKPAVKIIVISILCAMGWCGSLWAGGGGENLLLVVNPGDEQQVRIAAEYQHLRNIPVCNIVFIEPRKLFGFYVGADNESVLVNSYLNPIYQHIINNHLTNQIDYIAALGQPTLINLIGGQSGLNYIRSFQFMLTYLDGLATGQIGGLAIPRTTSRYLNPDSLWTNAPLHHAEDGLYVGTSLAYTGIFGNSPSDAISNLQWTAGSNGSKPTGTIYFEENDNIRSNIREPQWPGTKVELANRAIPYIEERLTPGSTPLNRTDVRGAVIGIATYAIPNGSTYLPGSWADSLTSGGCVFGDRIQTKAIELIRAGAGGSSGTVVEPYANPARFPHSNIFVYLADGATLGEAFYRSVSQPDLQMMLGDPLGQPYADSPIISVDTGPADGATVSGTISVVASATLSAPNLATAIDGIEWYIDGKFAGTTTNSGSFNLDTTLLGDGCHELRMAAVNNADISSKSTLIRDIIVNNDGRSVGAESGYVNAGTQPSVLIPVTSIAGSGTVSRIELRNMGRVLGQLSAGAGNVLLDVGSLAYATNTVIPVAVFSDGDEVAGTPLAVYREPVWKAGATPSLLQERSYGILGQYYVGQGGGSISNSTFSGTPDAEQLHSSLLIGVHDGVNSSYTLLAGNAAQLLDVDSNPIGSVGNPASVDQLSARYSGRFEVAMDSEYNFFFYHQNDSARLLIDGQKIMEIEGKHRGVTTYYTDSIFLAKGEHTLELLAANLNGGIRDGFFDVGLYVRDSSGITKPVDNSMIYQVGSPITALENDASFINESWDGFEGNVSVRNLYAGGDLSKDIGWFSFTGTGGAAPFVSGGSATVSMSGSSGGKARIYTGGLNSYSSTLFPGKTIITMRANIDQFPDVSITGTESSTKGISIIDCRRDHRLLTMLTPTTLWVNYGAGSWTSVPVATAEDTFYTWQFEFDDGNSTVDIFRRTSDQDDFTLLATNVPLLNQNAADQILFATSFFNADNTQMQGIIHIDYIRVGTALTHSGLIFKLMGQP